jgi:hypothetical protein
MRAGRIRVAAMREMTAQSRILATVEVVGVWLCGWRFALPRRSLRAVAAARRALRVASEVAS